MNKDIEMLIKIQGKINDKYHLHVDTDLKDNYKFLLFIKFNDDRDYFSSCNQPILASYYGDTVEELEKYLEKHEGFSRW